MNSGIGPEDLMADFAKSETLKCEYCNNVLFIQSYILKRVGALVSSTGKDQLMPIPVFSCGACGQIPSDMQKGLLDGQQNDIQAN